ncbi:MAG: Asp-tRNA(Asn)/Glu-tRNA(Gln) amidotransferase subunit GatB, partial [Candidatus Tectomicrobia bacterium]|nr:Asp-tRNA(Asn)/Glu-tRNA(Gln) amidotransferase subunit GatB [Candidatus Tectomicrobia bacterium]
LEVHAQLSTQSKIFCASSAAYGAAPNAHTSTVDLGLPGVLPVLNREVVEFTLRLGLAVGAEVAPACRFARKHYFYPDLPKGYQISQYEEPICRGGEVHLLTKNGAGRVVRLTRIHMEEDAGKLIHGEEMGDPQHSYVDFNRAGVPLLEIVTEPDLRSPEEAEAFLRKLRTLVRYLGICDGNMQEGSLRCDANISLRPAGSGKLGAKVEIKNINSFRNLRRALEYEEVRQRQALDAGRPIEQETRLWNDAQGATLGMRSKEYAHDYRYFPDPDLVPLAVGREWLDKVRAQLPELPDAKRERFQREYGLPPYDAEVLTEERALADYYESVVNITGRDRAKPASNWVMGEVLRVLNERRLGIEECPVTPERLARLIGLIEDGTISGSIAKTVFEKMAQSGKDPAAIVDEEGLRQISDTGALDEAIEKVLAAHPKEAEAYRGGRKQLLGFFTGQVMKATRGKANPQALQAALKEKLGG